LKREQIIRSKALQFSKTWVSIFSSLFITAGLISPSFAEEAAPVGMVSSQPGLVVNQVPLEVSLGAKFSLSGAIDPAKKDVRILRQTKKGEKWTTIGSTKSKADGTWRMTTTAPVKKGKTTYRIVVDRGDKPKSDSFTVVFKKAQVNLTAQNAAVNPANPIGFIGTLNPPANKVGVQLQIYDKKKKTAKFKYRVVTTSGIPVRTESQEQEVAVVPRIEGLGPNGRILGTDISRHQSTADFAKMYAAGSRYIFIKSSDGGPNAHARAVAFADQWIPAAKAAGLMVGQYHFAQIPNTDDMNVIIQSANFQADLMISRWNAHGGYSPGTLPLVFDIEQSGVPRNTTPTEAITFSKTVLEKVANATGKLPIIYSNPVFLRNYLSSDPDLAKYPLWIANYFDVSNPGVSPKEGCINTVWTSDGCNLRWTFWQYSQTGPGREFGVGSRGIDLNVFAGTAEELLALAGYPAAT
jgi:GH25 family lysozyme M1 (1,4-beta-N-acetylmuramidase)